jgi:arylsulfatase A-like enzyme
VDRRHFLISGALLSSLPTVGRAEEQRRRIRPRETIRDGRTGPASPTQPNILFIVSDQHRAGISKREGYPFDVKPTLDRYAAKGVDFARAYCTIPECCPSRISMLTGRWPDAHRVRMNFDDRDAYFTKDVYDVAREQGYRTALIGKNHTYMREGDLDFWREYHELSGYIAPGADPRSAAYEKWLGSTHFNVVTEPTPFPVEAQHPYRMVSDAIGFMEDTRDQRFIMQLSFPEVHNPEQVSEPYWDMLPPSRIPMPAAGPDALSRMGGRERWPTRSGIGDVTSPITWARCG